jgi:hypothetical protein
MIPTPVFSVWTFTLSLKDPEPELAEEKDVDQELVIIIKYKK